MLVFSFNQSKPKAFVPLAWAGYVLAGMAAETLVTMGIKAGSKAVLRKKADDYSAQALAQGKFDFMGTNPYRNKDGSITLSPSANDRAKMAGLISGALIGSSLGEVGNRSCLNNAVFPEDGSGQIEFNQQGNPIGYMVISDYGLHYAQYAVYIKSLVDNSTVFVMSLPVGATSLKIDISPVSETVVSIKESYILKDGTPYSKTYNKDIPYLDIIAENKNVALTVGEDMMYCDQLLFPTSVERVYKPPMDMTPDYKMPNHDLIVDKSITIYNVFPPSEQEGEITWNEIEDYYNTNGGDFKGIVDSNIDNYFEKGVIADNIITVGEINNIYTDTGLTPVDEFEPIPFDPDDNLPVDPGDNLPVPNPDGGELVPVDPIDRSLLQIAKESYQYLADTVKSSVDGLTAVTAGATGVITFLGTTMGWLPNEWIVMFSAAFGLGLFAFFFRR